LICGVAHTPDKDIISHCKYKKAAKNDVPIITMDSLLESLGITDLDKDLSELKQEITIKHATNQVVHFIWQGVTRFLVLPQKVIDALCRNDFLAPELYYF
jgi:hypothetical protein